MKVDKTFITLILITCLLIAGVFYFWPTKDQKIIINDKIDLTATKGEIEITKEDGAKVNTQNFAGIITKWLPKQDLLTIDSDGKIIEFKIDPQITKVFLSPTRNRLNLKTVSLVDKFKNLDHWPGAFCEGDSASITFNPDTKIVEQVFSIGYRACGFGGEIK